MYLHGIHNYPAIGVTAAEFRPLLEEMTRLRQSQGLDAQLTTTAYGGDYPALHTTIRFSSLSDLETFRGQAGTNPQIAQLTARISRLVRRGASLTLAERLVDPMPVTTPNKYMVRLLYRAAPGKGGELRALLTEHAKARQSQGVRMTANVQVAGPESGTYVLNAGFESLAKYEAYRKDLQANPQAAFGAKVAALISGPSSTEFAKC